MTQHNEDPTIEAVRLLRESGYHEAAADLATKALQRATAAPAAAKPPVAPAAPASRGAAVVGNHDDAVRREGEMMLAEMRRLGILAAAEPIDGEAA